MEKAAVDSDTLQRGTLYLGDLDPKTTEEGFILWVFVMGPIPFVGVCSDDSIKSLRYGNVNLYNNSAMACLNHTDLMGQPMRMIWSSTKSGVATLSVNYFDPSIESAHLQGILTHYGTILSAKGFGFVQFDSEESAIAACTALNDTMLALKHFYEGKAMNKAIPHCKEDRWRELHDCYTQVLSTVHQNNLDPSIESAHLQGIFGHYGTLLSAKGFGFVQFDSEESAIAACTALNDTMLALKHFYEGKVIDQAIAHRKEDRWRELHDCYAHDVPHFLSTVNQNISPSECMLSFPFLRQSRLCRQHFGTNVGAQNSQRRLMSYTQGGIKLVVVTLGNSRPSHFRLNSQYPTYCSSGTDE